MPREEDGGVKGRLYRRGKKGRFTIELHPRDPKTGGWRTVKIATGTTIKREAEARYAEELARYTEDGYLAPTDRRPTTEYLRAWLDGKARLAPATVAQYRYAIERRIIPAIGGTPLGALSPELCRQVIAGLRSAPLLDREGNPRTGARAGTISPRTVHLHYTVLREALEDAVRLGLLRRNPLTGVEPPGDRSLVRPRALTPDEARRLLEAARPTRFHALWRLALAAGLRVGELLALRWVDLDLEAGQVRIRAGKTPGSEATLPLDPDTVAALRAHRARQNEARLAAGALWADEGWVFARSTGRRESASNVRNRDLRRILEVAGLGRVRIHDLRHTMGSLMLEQGAPVKTVQERLRHRSEAFMLRRYAHSIKGTQERAAEAFGDLLSGRDAAKADVGRGRVLRLRRPRAV